MKKNTFILILLLYSFIVLSQNKGDYNWEFGYGLDTVTMANGGTLLSFNNQHTEVKFIVRDLEMFVTNASISDSSGNLQFYTNGCNIYTTENTIMSNGGNINPGWVHGEQCATGYTVPQGALVLPNHSLPNFYRLFHEAVDTLTTLGNNYYYINKLYMTKIDMSLNNGKGKVVSKNEIVLNDSLYYGGLIACKKSNGIDWWLMVPKRGTNKYFTIGVNDNGIDTIFLQTIGDTAVFWSGGFQSVFSPDGTKYARYDITFGLFLFDFDRSTGLLSNFQKIPFPEAYNVGGCAFSPNSQYLYIPNSTSLYQFDVLASDIGASKTLIDTFDGYGGNFPGYFFSAQLGPDCRIYICGSNGINALHVINHPDRKGKDCDFIQHGLKLAAFNASSMPNFPNYRLGVTPSYPCDSTILLSTAVKEIFGLPTLDIRVFPNPAQSYVEVSGTLPEGSKGHWVLFNAFGQKVLTHDLIWTENEYSIPLRFLPAGLYFYTIEVDGEVRGSGKLVKSE